MEQYDNIINERIKLVKETGLDISELHHGNRLGMDEYDEEFITARKERVSNDSTKNAEDHDGYIKMEVGLPRGPDGELENAVMKKRAVDVDDIPIGKANDNPVLGIRSY